MKLEMCLVRGCPAPAHCRGLCSKHYKSAQRIIARTHLTWDEIAEAGLCKPTRPKGRNPSEFSQRLLEIADKLHPPTSEPISSQQQTENAS